MSWRRCVIGTVLAVVAWSCADDEETSSGGDGSGENSENGGSEAGDAPECPVSNASSGPGECHLEADCMTYIQQVDCTGGDPMGYTCICRIDQREAGTFMSPTCNTGMPSEGFLSRINAGCGWSWTL